MRNRAAPVKASGGNFLDLSSPFTKLAIALGLGLLVGLQREHASSRVAGIRTFPLITLFGVLSGMLSQSFGGWVIAAALLSLGGLIILGNIVELKDGSIDPGLTTEAALLLMFGVGAYLVIGRMEVAIAVGGGVAVLLQAKVQMHGVAAKLGDSDLKALMQFVLLSLVILPILPDRTYGPYSVLNPRQIWLMVCLIVGISLAGYIIYKFFGERAGIVLGGILGGLISSTATTVSYARRTAASPPSVHLAAVVIQIASTAVFARVLLVIGVVSPVLLASAARPLLIMMTLMALLSLGVWFWGQKEQNRMPVQDNPSELKGALFFGVIFAVVLLAAAAAKAHFGQSGLYVVAALSGLTDMDAITLSTAQLVNSDRLLPEVGWKLIVVSALANLVFKAGAILVLGHRQLLARVGMLYGLALAGGSLLLWVGS
jgi:uncharacterized membrane protein (DUF4010 family)